MPAVTAVTTLSMVSEVPGVSISLTCDMQSFLNIMTEAYHFSASWGRISAEQTERPVVEQLGGQLEPAIAEHPYWRVKGQSGCYVRGWS